MKVVFIRHATAADKAGFGGSDLDRPLTDEGKDNAKRMFETLARLYKGPMTVFSSQAIRARETAEIFCKCFHLPAAVQTELLNPGSEFQDFRKLVSKVQKETEFLVVVGHEPDFSHILGNIVADGFLRIDVQKASCVEVEINSLCKGELKVVLQPKALEKMRR